MKYVLLQTTIGYYRQAVLQIIVNELGSDFWRCQAVSISMGPQ